MALYLTNELNPYLVARLNDVSHIKCAVNSIKKLLSLSLAE